MKLFLGSQNLEVTVLFSRTGGAHRFSDPYVFVTMYRVSRGTLINFQKVGSQTEAASERYSFWKIQKTEHAYIKMHQFNVDDPLLFQTVATLFTLLLTRM